MKAIALEFCVPIFDVNYIGENESAKSMWSDNDFFVNLKNYLIDPETQIILKRFPNDFVGWESPEKQSN